MPCRNDYDDSAACAEDRVRAALEPLLCEACAALEEKGLFPGQLSPELIKWYEAHSKKEKDRVAYEAVLKLTVKERKALGIDLNLLKKRAGK